MSNKSEKEKLLEWLRRLMEFAKDNRLSTRIIDGIADCIEMAEAHNPDMGEIKAAVEELLESIGHKTMSPAEKNLEEEEGISIDEIREEIAGMARRCQGENTESLQNIRERERAVIQKTYCELQEITHCKAHISELKSSEKYLRFYEQIRFSHERQAMNVFKEFLGDLSNNYQFMVEHMKSMLSSIGGAKRGLGGKRFYEEHDIKKENISRKLETMAKDADCGGIDIEEFGNATKGKIQKIVKKSVSRKRFFIWLPVLVIFLLLGTGIVLKYIQLKNVSDRATQEQEAEGNSELLDWVKNVTDTFLEEKAKGKAKESFAENIIIIIISVSVLIVLPIIVIYAVYIWLLGRMCNRRICRQSNAYLQTKLSQFKQRNPLSQKMDTVLNDLQEEYNRQYLDLLNQLFCKAGYDISGDSSRYRFEILKEEWTAIKYG